MASKRRLRRRSCEGKKYHKNQDQAFAHIREVSGFGSLIPYKCKFCKGWHGGHPNEKQIRAMNAKRAPSGS